MFSFPLEIHLEMRCLVHMVVVFFFFWPCYAACRILIPWPGVRPAPIALETQSLNSGLPAKSSHGSSVFNFLRKFHIVFHCGFTNLHSCQESKKIKGTVAQSCPTLCNPTDCNPPGSFVQGDSLGKITGVGCYALLQGIFLTQGSNPGLLHCRQILYHLSHQGWTSFHVPVGHSNVFGHLRKCLFSSSVQF